MNPQLFPSPSTHSAPFPARILVLDDERVIGKILGEMLILHGYVPSVCLSAGQALDLIAKVDFDLVLSDYRMPFMNGKEFFQAAVRVKPELASRIVFLTGDSLQEETKAFLESAGTPHLTKPFNFAALEKVLANILWNNLPADLPRTDPDACMVLCA